MKFDTIIIGGGLSGMSCGIQLARSGQRVAICASGESMLNMNDGRIDLLGRINGQEIGQPLNHFSDLSPEHPYIIIGVDRSAEYAKQVPNFFKSIGIPLKGQTGSNQRRITPMGTALTTWMQVEHMAGTDLDGRWPWQRVVVVNLAGMLDFPADIVASALERQGVQCDLRTISTEASRARRHSCSEMRATSLARLFADDAALSDLAEAINNVLTNQMEAVVMPAIVTFSNLSQARRLQEMVKRPLCFVPTMPPVAVGHAIAAMMRRAFEEAGGTFLNGETVVEGHIADNRVTGLTTARLDDDMLKADHYVLASGSFVGGGLVASPTGITEPVFGLDVDQKASRTEWTNGTLLSPQPFMAFGVTTDAQLRPSVGGTTIENLFAVGAILAGHNPLATFDGEGVDLVSAFHAAHVIQENSHSQRS